jgi:hypothetical protein
MIRLVVEQYNANYCEGTSLPFYVAKASAHLLTKGEAAELEEHGDADIRRPHDRRAGERPGPAALVGPDGHDRLPLTPECR